MEVNELIFLGMFGMISEICFTSVRHLIATKELSLIGHTSMWMFPVYSLGLSYGFDFIEYVINDNTVRWLSYPLWIWLVEICIGLPALKKGIRIWDYRYLPPWLQWKGIISFAHYPVWVLFGIIVEGIK